MSVPECGASTSSSLCWIESRPPAIFASIREPICQTSVEELFLWKLTLVATCILLMYLMNITQLYVPETDMT
ncbi:hypothetical protein DPMN_167731 [Dreissena polymorpha]|uniref:Uncharacterized protein n=1 Tax=Dreissena polymorpha TaxID=45954 RepID=A0A9D4EZC9_DREPO|nr:hypothetical protein DPMN_167731 [Dreissena polymorpha]